MPLTTEIFSRMVGKVVAIARENCIMPRYINKDYAAALAEKGNTVNVPVTSPISLRDIIPAPTSTGATNPAPTTIPVSLDFWKEAAFTLGDKDLGGLDDPESFINRQIEEAGRTVANAVDGSILDLYTGVPHRVGAAGSTPFTTSTVALQDAERVLISNLAPVGRRALVLDPFAHANALGLPAFQNALAFGGTEVIREGRISRALGYDWNVDQQMRFHQRGVATGTPLVNSNQPAGTTTLFTKGWTSNVVGILKKGDIITLAGDSSPYAVTADVNSDATGNAIVPITPGYATRFGLLLPAVDNAAIAVTPSHRVSLALHPDFAAFASRIASGLTGLPNAGYKTTWADPISGLVLLVKITEQYFQSEFSVSCLWGVRLIRSEFVVRVMG